MLMAGAAVVALVAAGAAGAADLYGPKPNDAVRGGKLTIGSLVEPPALDPFHQAADARIQVSVLMYQGLMYEDPSGIAQPLLAESMTVSPDGKIYTFKLRHNVKFHNGATMTAADVKYSYDYIRNPANGSPGAGDYQAIEAVEAPDNFTVIMRLSQPNAALPMTLTNKYGAVVPKDYFATEGAGARLNRESVGTGPFKLVALQPNSSLRLERFKDYWDPGAPYLDEVTFVFLPNSASLIVALKNERVDMALLSRPQDIEQLKDAKNLEVRTFPSLSQKSLDLDNAHPILKNEKVRQAIALGIDKEEILKASYAGYGKVIGTMVAGMQETWGLPLDEVPFSKRDPARAKQLLQEAGYADGLKLELITIMGYDWMDPAAVTLAEQLRPIGITLEIKKVELGVWIANFRGRKMGFTFNDWGTSPDPNLLFYRHFHKQPDGADFRNWNNDQASALLDAGQRESDPAKRQVIYREFQKVLGESVPTVMFFSPDWIVVSNRRVKNYVQHPTGWYFGLARTYIAK